MPYTQPLERTREIIEHLPQGVAPRGGDQRRASTPSRSRPGRAPGSGKPLKLINHPVREEIPIWVASMGPKNVEMTAELADGWFPFLFIPERAHDVWGDALAAGSARRLGRTWAPSRSPPAGWSPSATGSSTCASWRGR